jgi:hypothetical protein
MGPYGMFTGMNLDLHPEWLLTRLNICNMKCWPCSALLNDVKFVGIGS